MAVGFLVATTKLAGQSLDSEYEPAESGEWQGEMFPEADELIFNTPPWGIPDPFSIFARYRFGAVRYRLRGLDYRYQKTFLGNVDLSDNLNSYPDWGLVSLARRSGLNIAQMPSKDIFSLAATGDELYFLARSQDRYFRGGLDVRYAGAWGKEWRGRVALTGTVGDDGHLAGVRSDGIGGIFSTTKTWTKGQSLTLFLATNFSNRGARVAATEEAFALTDNDLYNPTWGLQSVGGRRKKRNSRMNSVRAFFTAAAFETPLGEARKLSVELAFRHNRDGRTRLAWYDAVSPMPDYYRKMPSWFPAGEVRKIVTDAWENGDRSITQVDWDALYESNILNADGHANYIVEEQIERSNDLHIDVNIVRKIKNGLEIVYGVHLRRDRSRFFKLADDLLGGRWVQNIDQYVSDDDDFAMGPLAENDLRNPGRRVYRGDRFGYDYAITRFRPSVYGRIDWQGPRHGVVIATRLDHTRLRRNGFYEKALFPGARSLGHSKTAAFTTVKLAVDGWWHVSRKHTLALSATAQTEPPEARNIFLSPTQNNLIVPKITPSGLYSAELAWVFASKFFDIRLAGFVNATTGSTEIRHYYDDLESTFSDMVVREIDCLGFGLELGVEARPAEWLTISVGASAGDFRYNSEPRATVFEDSTGQIVSQDMVCHLSGLPTDAPKIVAAAEIAYHDRRYWRASISCEYAGLRHVDVNPLYHSSRIVAINPAPEIMRNFNSVERLPDAFTLGLSLSKGFVLKRGFLRLAGSVRNLLSSRIIHSGYEQMRLLKRSAGYIPAPSKYLYSYPITWSVSISYKI